MKQKQFIIDIISYGILIVKCPIASEEKQCGFFFVKNKKRKTPMFGKVLRKNQETKK